MSYKLYHYNRKIEDFLDQLKLLTKQPRRGYFHSLWSVCFLCLFACCFVFVGSYYKLWIMNFRKKISIIIFYELWLFWSNITSANSDLGYPWLFWSNITSANSDLGYPFLSYSNHGNEANTSICITMSYSLPNVCGINKKQMRE